MQTHIFSATHRPTTAPLIAHDDPRDERHFRYLSICSFLWKLHNHPPAMTKLDLVAG